MKCFVLALAVALSAAAYGALPGVTEFKTPPEQITDAALATLLRERVSSADMVAIGETVHGSASLLRLQARLLRYLVTHHGFRLVVWENAPLRSLELTRWIAACTQTKTPAPLAALYFPTAADRAWLDWICEFNLAHPANPIVFRGMDVWDRPWEHYARLQSLGPRAGIAADTLKNIQTLCPAHQAKSWPEIDAVLSLVQSRGNFQPEAGYQKCRALLTTLLDNARQAARDKKPGADDAHELALSASTLLGWLGFYHYNWSDDILSWNERDRAQGRNLMLIMAQHNATRAIVAAHTSHVSHNRSPADWWGYGDLKSGIYFYQQLTQKKVFNIALTAFEASGAQGEWSQPAAANSLDKKLNDAGHVFSFFASNAAFLSEHKTWWMQNQNFPGPYESGVEIVPRDHFDAFFFFKQSRLDKALPARSLWQP